MILAEIAAAPTSLHPIMAMTPARICWIFLAIAAMQAGQLLLFLRQSLKISDEVVVKQCLKWAAALQPDTTQESMAAVAACLQQQFQLSQQQLLAVLQAFPSVLGWDVEEDILPKLEFFKSLGPSGQQLLDTMYDKESGWLQVGPRCRG